MNSLRKVGAGLLWVLWDFPGFRYLWRKINPEKAELINDPDYKRPSTFFLWVIGVYIALYGVSSTRYELALDRVENRMSAVASQLSTSNEAAFLNLLAQIPFIQDKEVPVEPQLWPLALSSIYDSFTRKTPNPEILAWTKEILVLWKKSLAGAQLRKAKLAGAKLLYANLARAKLRSAQLARLLPS